MLHLMSPAATGLDHPVAHVFFDALREALGNQIPSRIIADPDETLGVRIDASDVIAVFCAKLPMDAAVHGFLARASRHGARVVPVSLEATARYLPAPNDEIVPFPVYEWLGARSLPESHVGAVARRCAWQILSGSCSTFAKRDITMFVSYGREHGEKLAREVEQALNQLGHVTVRDNTALRAGDVVRPAIAAALGECDVLVLLDSPAAIESPWVDWEVKTAAAMGVATVWVDLGGRQRKKFQDYLPADRPDLHPDEGFVAADLAEEIDRLAREKLLGSVPSARRLIERLGDWAFETGAEFVALDESNGIYQVDYRVTGPRYPERSRRHIVQVFARRPERADRVRLDEWLEQNGYLTHAHGCRGFDAAVMATAAPGGLPRGVDGYSAVEEAEHYLQYLTHPGPAQVGPPDRPGLLLFGSFPKGQAAGDQIIAAARELTATWIRLGGDVSFGGHPTIRWHVVHAAEGTTADTERHVHLYQSGFFRPSAELETLERFAQIVTTERAPTRAESLDKMRRTMVRDSGAAAAAAIGGRSDEEGTHEPGVALEVELARQAAIPVFLLGATGGNTAELVEAARSDTPPFASLGNGLDEHANNDLAETDDYASAAERIWTATVGSG